MAKKSIFPHKRRPKRLKPGLQDQKSYKLYEAGLSLLAQYDYEQVAITKLTKEAGVSVGAFYYRYKNKDAFLRQIIATTFRRLENSYEDRFLKTRANISVADFVAFISSELGNSKIAGVIRATLKLGATQPEILAYYENYREFIANSAGEIFSNKKASKSAVSGAIQLLFAAINDVIIMPNSAVIKISDAQFTEMLTGIIFREIGRVPSAKLKPERIAKVADEPPPTNVRRKVRAI